MGQDKANLLLGEQTLLQRVTDIVQPLFTDVIVSVREPRWIVTCCKSATILARRPHWRPGSGSALTESPWVFAVACDMPFITRQLIECLAGFREGVDAVVPVVQGYPEPLAHFMQRAAWVHYAKY